jgi:hypothetical protein
MGKWRVVFSPPIALEAADLGTMTSARGHDLYFSFGYYAFYLPSTMSAAASKAQ